MSEWPVLSLKHAGVQLIDCVHKTPEARESGYAYVAIPQMKSGRIDFSDARKISEADFREWTKKAKPQKHDVILSRRTNPGVIAVDNSETDFALGQNLVLLRANGKRVHPPFLRWLCVSDEWWGQIDKYINAGAIFSSLRCGDVPNFELTIPPLPEQREIAAILGALDDKIEVNRKASATLKAMARALYRSCFVDFDPVWAKLENRSPAHMPPETAALFPDSFDDEGLPQGWVLTTIGDVADIVGGGTPSTKQPEFWEDGQHLWATPKDLSNNQGPVLLNTERRITDLGLSKISSGLLPAGSLLLSSRAPIGYLVIAQRPVAINQGFIGIRETEMVSGIEAYHWCVENMELIHANANGSTFQEIAKKNFRPLPYVLAPENVRNAFNSQAGDYFARIAAFAEENQTLATLRDSLLPRLMSGELRVGDARAQVEEVA
ncbi:restriction endonuclease subunit S [Roseovarius mucosus]|uniref:restriction endonuclease subunit S n=1 Tax=Roseovarius mucosus TaxID=215743 RepID=UPI003F7047ED